MNRRAARSLASLACAAALLPIDAARADVTVALRGGAADRVVADAKVLAAGLEVRVAGGKADARAAVELIPWDEVRGVVSADPSRIPGPDELAMAEDLWRARIRVARGDSVLARPLLERHWPKLRGADGPTAQLVAEGLLRSAVDAGDLAAAIEPWIECLRLGTDGTASRFPALPGVLDDATGLLPAIGPFAPASLRPALAAGFEAAAAFRPAAGEPTASRKVASSVSIRMARLIRLSDGAAQAAADAAAAPPAGAPATAATESSAPALRVLELIEAIETASDQRERERAVAMFDKQYPEPPAFLACWRLAAVATGASRAARATTGDARAAALVAAALDHLAIPASGLDQTGLVDAYALEEAERLVREAGDQDAANSLAALRDERLRAVLAAAGRQARTTQDRAGDARPKGP